MKQDSPLVLASLLFCSLASASAEEVRLEWQPNQISTRLGYYMPLRLQLSEVKPEGVTKTPEGLLSPRYGTLQLGPKDAPTKAVVLLDEPDGGPARLWIDRNGNGDLTDDPPTVWEPGKPPSAAKWAGSGSVDALYGGEKRSLGLSLYRFDKADPKRAALKDVLLYYRTFGLAGDITLGGTKYASVLVDDSAIGDFRGTENSTGASVSLMLDLNADGKFDSKVERFDIRAPFNVGGKTYEISGLTASGASFTIAPSSKTVAERPKAPAIGAKPFAFEQPKTAGGTVRFPEDYKEKLVLLDFWATWCGPCIKELPELVKVYEEFHERGFEILGVSLDDANGLAKLEKFAADKGMKWPQVCDTKAWRSPIAEGYGVSGIPAAFLVDGKTGNIVAMGTDLRGAKLRETVEQCLAKLGTGTAVATTATPPGTVPPAAPAPPGESTLTPTTNDALAAKAAELMNAGKLLTSEAFAAQKQNPQPGPVTLAPPATATLPGREIAKRAGAGYLRAGWYFQCTKCQRWHTNLAGGYAIARDTAVTAHHVMNPPENMKAGVGYPILVRGESDVVPVTAVLADDAAMDAIVLRVGVNDLSPLPLGSDAQVGDSVWCLSDPRGERGYFSNGIVNRFLSRPPGGGLAQQRINVSTDWAPGSSGAAILDSAGNVVGHVATIRALFSKPPVRPAESKPGESTASTTGTAMNVHEAIPAKSVRSLIAR